MKSPVRPLAAQRRMRRASCHELARWRMRFLGLCLPCAIAWSAHADRAIARSAAADLDGKLADVPSLAARGA
jgi:hypothetical protein